MYEFQKEYCRLVPVPPTVVARSGKNHPESFNSEGAGMKKIVQSEIKIENWLEVVGMEKRQQEVYLNLCTKL